MSDNSTETDGTQDEQPSAAVEGQQDPKAVAVDVEVEVDAQADGEAEAGDQ